MRGMATLGHDALNIFWILRAALAWLVLATRGETMHMNQVDVAGLVCGVKEQNVTSSFEVPSAQFVDVTQPHIVTIMRSDAEAAKLTFTVKDADGVNVLPTSPYVVNLMSVHTAGRRLKRAGSRPAPRPRASPRPRPSPTPRRRRASPASKPGPRRRVSARRPPAPQPQPSSASSIGGQRRRAGNGIEGQSYPSNAAPSSAASGVHRRRVQPYGYSNQQTLNNNYGGNAPGSTGYGYSGANAIPQNSPFRTGAMVGGAMVGGAVVGAGAMYLWRRMGDRRNDMRGDMRDRLQNEGARSGVVTISLQWFNTADMDLWVYLPQEGTDDCKQNKIYYANRRMDGGWLDVDANAGVRKTSSPVENIDFESGRRGKYCVKVDCFSGSCQEFEVIVRSIARVSNQDWENGHVWEQDSENGNQGTMVFFSGSFGASKETQDICTFQVTDLPTRQYCMGRDDRAGDIMNCDDCRVLFSQECERINCADSGCDTNTKSDLGRDDLMEAMFVPEHFKSPFEVSVEHLQGDGYTNSTCDPTARQPELFLMFSQMSTLGSNGACSIDVDQPCSAETSTGCYDNEVCDGAVCVCEPGACLDENFLCEFAMAGDTNIDVNSARMAAAIGIPLIGRMFLPLAVAIYAVFALI